MGAIGNYLTGVAAILAATKFIAPYVIIALYRKRFSNEIIWRRFLDISKPDPSGRILETAWIAGLVGYFRRCEETLHMGNPWYEHLPGLTDEVYWKFGSTKMLGKHQAKLFDEIKELLADAAEIVALNSTPSSPINKPDKYNQLIKVFKCLIQKSDQLNDLVVPVPVPFKTVINGNEFYSSFFKKNAS